MIGQLLKDLVSFWNCLKRQDLPFFMACGYIIFSYLRPQAIYPFLDILPWTQLCILTGLAASIVKKQFEFSFAGVLMLFFVFSVVLSTFFSLYPEVSWIKLDVIFIWFFEVLFFINCIKNKEQLKLILILFFLTIFKMSFFGARTWVSRGFGFTKWGIAGPSGFFANSGEFSLLMAMVAMLSLGFLIGVGKLRSVYFLLPLTCIMTVLGASSRGSQIAVLVGVFYILISYKKLNFKYLIVISTVLYLGFNLVPEEQMERFRSMGSDNTSQSRLKYWSAGWDMFSENPFFGVGFYGFAEHYYRYYKVVDPDDYLSRRKEVAHNSFIEILSTMGAVGIAIYMLIIFYINNSVTYVRKVAKSSDNFNTWIFDFATGLRAALIVYLIGSTFMSVAFYPYIYLLLMFAFLQRKTINMN